MKREIAADLSNAIANHERKMSTLFYSAGFWFCLSFPISPVAMTATRAYLWFPAMMMSTAIVALFLGKVIPFKLLKILGLIGYSFFIIGPLIVLGMFIEVLFL